MAKRIVSSVLLTFMLTLASASALVMNGLAWSNGGYSSDPANPDYGTHDWIAEQALDWLPMKEKQYILDNLAAYLYGTELPDNRQAPDGIGDIALHHIYFNSGGYLIDDAAAVRAITEFNNTLTKLSAKDYENAAKNAGIMTHYIADVAVFAHVMGSKTDWGSERHHSDYEEGANGYTLAYDSAFTIFLMFDGSLSEISPYEAILNLAYDTTFDVNGNLTAVWMDQNYDWNNQTFKERVGESLNLAVNCITDVLHTLYVKYVESETEVPPPSQPPSQPSYLPTFPQVTIPPWTIGAAIAATALIVIFVLTRRRPQQSKGKLVRFI